MNRYGINFYSENLDINASVYFEAEDFFAAKKKALTFQKEGWVAGNTFFIDEKTFVFMFLLKISWLKILLSLILL